MIEDSLPSRLLLLLLGCIVFILFTTFLYTINLTFAKMILLIFGILSVVLFIIAIGLWRFSVTHPERDTTTSTQADQDALYMLQNQLLQRGQKAPNTRRNNS